MFDIPNPPATIEDALTAALPAEAEKKQSEISGLTRG